jgi:hypothetical protein
VADNVNAAGKGKGMPGFCTILQAALETISLAM